MNKAKFFLIRNIPFKLHLEMKVAADGCEMSMREFIMQAIREKLARM
jgi:hypothetical protein